MVFDASSVALVKCRECSGTVADDAAACPHCGTPKPWQAKTPKKVAKKAPKKVAKKAPKKAAKKAAKKAPAKKVVSEALFNVQVSRARRLLGKDGGGSPRYGGEDYMYYIKDKPEVLQVLLDDERRERKAKQKSDEWSERIEDWSWKFFWGSMSICAILFLVMLISGLASGRSPGKPKKNQQGITDHDNQLRLSDPDRLQPDTPRR